MTTPKNAPKERVLVVESRRRVEFIDSVCFNATVELDIRHPEFGDVTLVGNCPCGDDPSSALYKAERYAHSTYDALQESS